MNSALADRVAGAPISWGVSEVPGWGPQLPVDEVLRQMRELGLRATELGPDGFLPQDPAAKAVALRDYDLRAVAQFVPVVLHEPEYDPLPEVEAALEGIIACGAATVVVAAATGRDGYEQRPELTESGRQSLNRNLDRIVEAAAAQGVVASLHPHVGTMIETGAQTEQVLAESGIGLCLDTGHLLVGGGDPVALAVQHPERITHVHLKDVSHAVAQRVRDGQIGYYEGILEGLYVPLGQGDLDLAAIVTALEGAHYQGWYVLEQDVVVDPDQPGQPQQDVRSAIAHLLALAPVVA